MKIQYMRFNFRQTTRIRKDIRFDFYKFHFFFHFHFRRVDWSVDGTIFLHKPIKVVGNTEHILDQNKLRYLLS
jgi:hypothetical protein